MDKKLITRLLRESLTVLLEDGKDNKPAKKSSNEKPKGQNQSHIKTALENPLAPTKTSVCLAAGLNVGTKIVNGEKYPDASACIKKIGQN